MNSLIVTLLLATSRRGHGQGLRAKRAEYDTRTNSNRTVIVSFKAFGFEHPSNIQVTTIKRFSFLLNATLHMHQRASTMMRM